jgi:Cd2+/Zn2+-exporting ATPase
VVFLALGLAVIPPLLNQGTFDVWIYRALVFLVVSCPCALVISIPLGFFGGIGGASKEGILMKGSQYLEALNQVHTVVFDKTGTLTKGIFQVTNIYPVQGLTKKEFIEYGALAESYSNHPIAKSILKAYGEIIDESLIKDYEEISGEGIQATIKGRKVLLGNKNYILKETFILPTLNENKDMGTKIYMSIDGEFAGYLVISDEIKVDSKLAIDSLRKIGVKRLIMLTGDLETVAKEVASNLKLDGYYAELLPHQKVEKMEELKKNHNEKGKLVFVGDGINDAPVLALADIGIAMGGLGSDAAIEAADIVIMNDEPSKIATAIKISRRTKTIVWQNIFFAFGVKAIVLVLGAGGLATMWEAVFADVGVTIIAVFNAMRVLNGNYSEASP